MATQQQIPCCCLSGEIPNLVPGWFCGACRGYNGMWRTACKHCRHARCALRPRTPAEIERLWDVWPPNRAICSACGPGRPTDEADLQAGPRGGPGGLHHVRCPRVAASEGKAV